MVYLGSKQKISKYIIPILQKCIDDNHIENYYEPFCGGCNIIDKIKCKNRFAYDKSDTLIALLQTAAEDFDKILKEGTRELWDKGKAYVKDGIVPLDMTLADIGAMEFFASYATRGFPGGYAQDTEKRKYYKERYDNLQKQAPLLKDIIFKCQDYTQLDCENNSLIYIDPPYQGTKIYGYKNQKQIDYKEFWQWCREKSINNFVFISEQSAPEDFIVIWEKEYNRLTKINNNFKATEKLFIYNIGKQKII